MSQIFVYLQYKTKIIYFLIRKSKYKASK